MPHLNVGLDWRESIHPRINFFLLWSCGALAATWLLLGPLLAESGSPEGMLVGRLELRAAGPLRRISTADLWNLVALEEGRPYLMSKAKQTVQRLYATRAFHDVQVEALPVEHSKSVDVKIHLVRRYLLQEVRFSGDLQLANRELRRELALREGQAYSHEQLQKTLTRLQELYRQNGFYQAQIEPGYQLDGENALVTLSLIVEAGKRATVGSLNLDYDGEIEEREIHSRLATRPGGGFSRVDVEDDIRSLRHYLARQGFLRSNVYLKDNFGYDPQTNTVDLNFGIVLREKTEIRLEGLEENDQELRELLLFQEGSPANVFLEDTANQLLESFQTQGYLLAQCRVETPDGNPTTIVISVDRGEKFKVGDLLFEGNRFAESGSLEKILQVRRARLFDRGRFTTAMAQADVERIRSYYRQRGFLDVKVDVQSRLVEGSDRIRVVFRLQEGPRYFTKRLSILGNQEIDTDLLMSEIRSNPGNFFSPVQVAQDRASIIAAYENRGFRDVDFRSEVSYPAPGEVEILYLIEEGDQVVADEVIVSGNHHTREAVLEREVVVRKAAPIAQNRVFETEANLYDLAVFSRVNVFETPSFIRPGAKIVHVNVEEAKRYTLVYGIGYSSFEGVRGTLGITDSNFQGRATALWLGLRAGAQRQRATLSYRVPRFLERKASTVFSVTADNEKALTESVDQDTRAIRGRPFDSLRLVASAQTEQRLSRRELLFFRYNLERVRLDVPSDLATPLQFFREESRLRFSNLSIAYLNESRDDPSNPREGFFLSGEALLSARLVGSEREFFRVLTQGQYYRKLFPDLLLASSLRIGWIAPFGTTAAPQLDNPIPISERFFSGGSSTLRGLTQDLAGPLLTDADTGRVILVNDLGQPDPNGRPIPLGGNGLVIANLELRFPLVSILSGALFYDVGNVFSSFTELGVEGASQAVGLGVRINSPVGPLRVDAGYNPSPPDVLGFRRWNLHLTLGHPF